jgi:hypothetical protein
MNQTSHVSSTRASETGSAAASNLLILPHSWHQQLLERHLDPTTGFLAVGRLGKSNLPDGGCEWLVREVEPDLTSLARADAGAPRIVFTRNDGSRLVPWLDSVLPQLPDSVVVELVHGIGVFEGLVWGFCRSGSKIDPLEELRLPGPGMITTPLRNPGRKSVHSPSLDLEPLSRTIGAFGSGGDKAMDRLQSAPFAIFGASRTGLYVAEWATRLGIPTILCDPKPLKRGHLGEISIALGEEDVGRSKVEAFSHRLGEWSLSRAPVVPIVNKADSSAGVAAAKRAAVLVDACDSDAGRLATAIYAIALHRPHLSIATGVHFDNHGRRVLGADIRLIVPGTSRCLLCLGGVSDYRRALSDLWSNRKDEDEGGTDQGWRIQRGGSLGSLNRVAVGIALRLLEDLYLGRIEDSRWLRCEWSEDGRVEIREPSPGPGGCDLCREPGRGDLAYPSS